MEPLPEHDTARTDTTPSDSHRPDTTRIDDLAARIAGRSAAGTAAFADAAREFEDEYRSLLAAIAGLHARFAFDRDGRPGAIAAVRDALPPVECDLLDAIVDDHVCEVAAIEEALWRVARAAARR
jgi:hypothetical protein